MTTDTQDQAPPTGGSWVRDPETGELTRAHPPAEPVPTDEGAE